MKIYMANESNQTVGGGFSFLSNFKKGMGDSITGYDEADIFFISGTTMVSRDEVQSAKRAGKKIVLRVDNAVRNSRNRNTGMSRMRDFAEWADLVIYQSKWARDYLYPVTKKDGVVILNGTDQSVFNAEGRAGIGKDGKVVYLYSRFNRDETKNWEMARYWFSEESRSYDYELWIVGQFSPELVESKFDFYLNEKYRFLGVQPPEGMAAIYKQSHGFLYSYFNDCCSNALIEALSSGCGIADVSGMLETGGAPEIMARSNDLSYFGLPRMAQQYREALEGL